MRTKKVFSVYDCKAEAYLTPFFVDTIGVAIRMIRAATMDTGHDFHRFGGDYTLFEIGWFYQETGNIVMHEAHVNHGTALAIGAMEDSQ